MWGAEVDMARWVWVGERASDQMGPEGRGVVCYKDVVMVTCVEGHSRVNSADESKPPCSRDKLKQNLTFSSNLHQPVTSSRMN